MEALVIPAIILVIAAYVVWWLLLGIGSVVIPILDGAKRSKRARRRRRAW